MNGWKSARSWTAPTLWRFPSCRARSQSGRRLPQSKTLARRIQHRVLEDTELGSSLDLRALPISALKHWLARPKARFMPDALPLLEVEISLQND